MTKARNLEIGSGIPKICVPLSSSTGNGLILQARAAIEAKADFVEWRADFYEHASDFDATRKTLAELRQTLGEMPLLFTLRTKNEGGNSVISREKYVDLCKNAVSSGFTDLVDAELSSGENALGEIISAARKAGVAVIVSSHNFALTPPVDALLSTLKASRDAGADIAKLAVMPQSPDDVLSLLTATERFSRENPRYPVITMSMGGLGKISRVSGGVFGSAVSFASLDAGTAPGQLCVAETRAILNILSL